MFRPPSFPASGLGELTGNFILKGLGETLHTEAGTRGLLTEKQGNSRFLMADSAAAIDRCSSIRGDGVPRLRCR